MIYVASASSIPVNAYPAGSNGPVLPTISVPDPNVPGTVWDPWGVTFDSGGEFLVQSFLSNATTFVYPDGTGVRGPSRIFVASNPDSQGIAVDSAGYEYILGTETGSTVSVAPPGATGSANHSFQVAPTRTFTTDQGSFSPWPDSITTDARGDIVVAVERAQGNAIEVYPGGAVGAPTPIMTITGPSTGLGSCTANACDHASVTYSPVNEEIYVAVSAGSQSTVSHVSAFTETNGDNAPITTISGVATGLSGNQITGLAISPLSGVVFAMVRSTQFGGTGQVESFGSAGNGDIDPNTSFTDASTGFANAEGIAISPLLPDPSTPEVPASLLLPLIVMSVGGGALFLQKRRRHSL
jgi:hypothetical protein